MFVCVWITSNKRHFRTESKKKKLLSHSLGTMVTVTQLLLPTKTQSAIRVAFVLANGRIIFLFCFVLVPSRTQFSETQHTQRNRIINSR